MKIFVTGSTGVLGRPVVQALVSRGEEVLALARSEANRTKIRDMGATAVTTDLYDPADLARWLQGCDAVLHLATRIPDHAEMNKPGAWSQNDRIREQGTRALVDAALAVGSIRTFIYPSICFMYADAGDRWQSAADARILPLGPLKSTLTAEAEVSRFASAGPENRGVSLRFGAFYGPASKDSLAVLAMARKGIALSFASRYAYKSQIWIDDAALAIVAALDHAPSGIFDVAEDEPFTQEQADRAVAEALGRKRLFRIPRSLVRLAMKPAMREFLARSQRVSSQAFKQATGWSPQVPNQSIGWKRIVADQLS